jgi:hypothetical protein
LASKGDHQPYLGGSLFTATFRGAKSQKSNKRLQTPNFWYDFYLGNVAENPVPDYFSLKEYAERRGISLRTLHRWLKKGIIKAEQPYGKRGKWFISK